MVADVVTELIVRVVLESLDPRDGIKVGTDVL